MNDDIEDSAGYSDLITDFGFFVVSLAACAGLAAIVVLVVS